MGTVEDDVLRVEVANTGSVAKNSRGFGIGLENVRGRLESSFPVAAISNYLKKTAGFAPG
jgi:LytS/YehU family sensor histidine kinase